MLVSEPGIKERLKKIHGRNRKDGEEGRDKMQRWIFPNYEIEKYLPRADRLWEF